VIALSPVAEPSARPGVVRGAAVAHLVSHLRGGGLEQCVVNLANHLADDGWRPYIFCLQRSGDLERKLRDGVTVRSLDKKPGNDFRLPWRLAALLKRDGIDVVHCHNWSTLLEGLLAARLAGVRAVVHTQHGLDYGFDADRSFLRDRTRLVLKRFASRGLGHVVAVSREVRDTIVTGWRVPEARVSVIHNGIEPAPEPPTPDERAARRAELGLSPFDLVVGSVGALRPVKDYPMLLDAFARVRRELPGARLVLVGNGPSRADLEAQAQRLELGRAVHFCGWRSDASALLPLMDVFALSSRSEGISLAVLEAMAAGLPVVATRVGGNPEIVEDGVSGLLVPPSDPQAMAAALVALARDPRRRQTLGASGRARGAAFSLPRMIERYEEMYASVLG
jgi:sugar transferase (PEP-CTERM/EpsH1 system associated)